MAASRDPKDQATNPEIKADTRSPLQKHIDVFADENGVVSYASMYKKLLALGETEAEAKATARKVTVGGVLLVTHCPFRTKFKSADAVGKMNHARDTGIFNMTGYIDEDRWNELKKYAEMDGDIEIITEKRFYEFLDICRQKDTRSDKLGLAKKSSDGEWSKTFKMCTDFYKGTERCFTIANLRQFYEDSAEVFDEVEAKRLPAPRP